MPDFTSSLYLGFRHDRESLRPWAQMTTGVPAALAEPQGAEEAANRLARLQGCQAAVLAPSTLHLFWDLFGVLAREGAEIFMDDGTYPIGQWGAERAAGLGAPLKRFPHRDLTALAEMVTRREDGRKAVVVADGVCACCGAPMPVQELAEIARQAGGLLVLDDTQALGLLGSAPGPQAPYGTGGGGSLRFAGMQLAEIVLISSLAKGFGAPLAALSGSRELVQHFRMHSETRIHCSPPSAASIQAALHALELNDAYGDRLRQKLSGNIKLFRRIAAMAGFPAEAGWFPVQSLRPAPELDAQRAYAHMLEHGVRVLLRQCPQGKGPRLSFVITARHKPQEIRRAVQVLRSAVSVMTPA